MRRTIYKNRFLVDEVLLNNTENSKIAEILLHHEVLGEEGVIDGLEVSPSAFVDGTVDVTAGSAVLPNKEIVKIVTDKNVVEMASSALSDINIVIIAYEESLSNPKPAITGSANNLVFADPTPTVRVYTPTDYLALTQSDRDSMLVIAVVEAAGNNVAIPSQNIFRASLDRDILDFSGFEVLKGVLVKSTTIEPTPALGSVRYHFGINSISFVSPNNPSPPAANSIGSSFYTVDTSLDEPVTVDLADAANPNEILTVQIYGSTLAKGLSSFSDERSDELLESSVINGSVITEEIELKGLYSQGRTEIENGVLVQTKIASAEDWRHRSMLGSGLTTDDNPHGLALSDITGLFETIPGSIRIGEGLLDTSEEASWPRIAATASDNSDFTLLFESSLPSQGSEGVTPLRLYLNAKSGNDEQNAGFTFTVNAKYNPIDNIWSKDNTAFSSTPAIKFELNATGINVSYNTSSSSFSENGGWDTRLLTDEEQTFIRNSIGLVAKSNQEHNSSDAFTGILNFGNSNTNFVKTLIYEDKNTDNGGMRVYFGRDFHRSSGDNVIEFTYNCKPLYGTTDWRKDASSEDSYVFRFRFNSDLNDTDSLQALVYPGGIGSLTVFDDSFFQDITFKLPGGFETVDEGTIEGLFTIGDGDSLTYQEATSRQKVIGAGRISYSSSLGPSSSFGRSSTNIDPNTGVGPPLPTEDRTSDYFVHDDADRRILSRGLNFIANVENIDKNNNESKVPRYVWRGPERGLWKANTSDGFDGARDVTFVGTSILSNDAIHKWLYPIEFEEDRVEIQNMTMPLDYYQAVPYSDEISLVRNQEFEFEEDFDSVNRWFRFSFVRLNLISGSERPYSPDREFSLAPIVWRPISNSLDITVESAVYFRNPEEGEPLYVINKSDFAEGEVLYLKIESNKINHISGEDNLLYQFLGISSRGYRPILIGPLTINYTTFNIE